MSSVPWTQAHSVLSAHEFRSSSTCQEEDGHRLTPRFVKRSGWKYGARR